MAVNLIYKVKIDTKDAVGNINKIDSSYVETLDTLEKLEIAQMDLNEAIKKVSIGSEEYKQLEQQLRQVNTELKNSDLAMEALDNEQLGTSIKSVAGGLTDIAGGLALIGVSGEGIEKVAETFAQVEGLSKVVGGAFDIWNDGLKLVRQAQNAAAASSAALTTAQIAQGTATKGAAIQQGILNAVMNANPVFLLITGIAALTTAFVLFTGKSKEAEEAEKKRAEETKKAIAIQKAKKQADDEARKSISSESSAFVGLIYQLKETNKNSKERQDLIKQINGQYGTTLQNLSDETAFQTQLNNAVKEYIAFQTLKVRQERADKYTTALINKQLDAQQKINKALNETTKSYGYTKVAKDQYQSSFDGEIVYLAELRRRYQDLDQVLLENEKIIRDTEDGLESMGASQLSIKKQIDDITNSGKKYVQQSTSNVKATEKETKAYKDASEAMEKLIESELRLQNINEELAEYEFGKNLESATESQLESIKKTGKYTTDVIDGILKDEKRRKDEIIKNEAEIAKSKTQSGIEIEAIDKEMQLKLDQNNDEYEQTKKDTYSELEMAQEKYAESIKESDADITESAKEESEKRIGIWKDSSQIIVDLYNNIGSAFNAWASGDLFSINNAFAQLSETVNEFTEDALLKLQEGFDGLTDEEKIQAIADMVMNITSITTSAIDAMNQARFDKEEELRNASYEKEKELLDNQLAERLLSQEEYDTKIRNLDDAKKRAEEAAKQKAFRQQKRLAILNAIMNTAGAVVMALASSPPPANYILAGVNAGLGAAQIAIISKQEYRAARGGVVPGVGSPNFDSVPALLAPGETVINSRSSSMFPNLLSEINKIGGGMELAPSGAIGIGGGDNETVFTQGNVIEALVSSDKITKRQSDVDRARRNSRFE